MLSVKVCEVIVESFFQIIFLKLFFSNVENWLQNAIQGIGVEENIFRVN